MHFLSFGGYRVMKIFCTNCGGKIEDTYKFCPLCGTIVAKHDESATENDYISNQYMQFKKNDDGEEVFYFALGIDENIRFVEFAKGNAARLCKNAMMAYEQLKTEGFSLNCGNMLALINSRFDLSLQNCEVFSTDAIVKGYKAENFFRIIGYIMNWNDLPKILDVSISDFSRLKQVDILREVMKKEMSLDMPVEKDDAIRIGESLLFCQKYDAALNWYKSYIEDYGDKDGYVCNIIGRLYWGEPNNEKKTLMWLTKSADRNNLLGNLNLGEIFSKGIIVEKNIDEALKYYLRAYKQGSKYAIYRFNEFMKYNMVDIHETGFRMENDYDYNELVDDFELMEKSKDGPVILNLGYMYQHGLGRQTSIEKAIYLYKKCININNEYSVQAKRMLNELRKSGFDSFINNDTEYKLKQLAYAYKVLKDSSKEKSFIKAAKFGENPPKKPVLQHKWSMSGKLEDYNENDCYSQAEFEIERKIYEEISTLYNKTFNQWKETYNKKSQKIDGLIGKSQRDIYNIHQIENLIEEIFEGKTKAKEDALAFAYDYIELTGETIEEGIKSYKDSKEQPKYKIEGNNAVISQKDGSIISIPIVELLGKLSKMENELSQLENEDNILSKSIFDKKKPIKPANLQALNREAPLIIYKGRICNTEQEFKNKLAVYFQEMKKYYDEKLKWLDSLPQKRLDISKKICSLRNEAEILYKGLNISYVCQNKEAIDYILKYMGSSQCSLQMACKAFEEYKKAEKERIAKEEEQKRKIKEEQERRRKQQEEQERKRMEEEQNNSYEITGWDSWDPRDYERERYYDDKYGKKDLLGSSVCIKRFQTGVFDLKHRCRNCPQARYCTRA